MQLKNLEDPNLYPFLMDIQRIGNRAVREAQERHRKLGIANVYSRNGVIYYEKNDENKSL